MSYGGNSKANYLDTTFGPIGLWNLNGTLVDSSGNGFNLTVETGSARYSEAAPGLVGFHFDTSNGLIYNVAEARLRILGELTIELLVSVTAIATSSIMTSHLSAGEAASNNALWDLTVNTNNIAYFSESGSGVDSQYNIGFRPSVGGLHHVCLVRGSNAQVQWYIDGAAFGSPSTGLLSPTDGSTGRFRIGRDTSGNSFTGSIASFKILNKALNPGQILSEYNRSLGPYYGIVRP